MTKLSTLESDLRAAKARQHAVWVEEQKPGLSREWKNIRRRAARRSKKVQAANQAVWDAEKALDRYSRRQGFKFANGFYESMDYQQPEYSRTATQ